MGIPLTKTKFFAALLLVSSLFFSFFLFDDVVGLHLVLVDVDPSKIQIIEFLSNF